MHIKLLSVAITATILTGCGTLAGGGASEGEAVQATKSYIASSTGSVVGLSGDGCLHSSSFDDETMIGSCEGKGDAMMKEEGDKMMAEAPKEEEAPAATPPPPPPPPPAPAPAPEPVADVEKVVLSGRALFPYDSAQLTGQGNREMTTLIDKLKSYSDIELIDVVGHAELLRSRAMILLKADA